MQKNIYILIVVFFILIIKGAAQNIVAFQGFEGTASDNWTFISPAQGTGTGLVTVGAGNYGVGYAKTGSFSMRAGGGSTGCGSGSACCVNGAGSGGSCTANPNGKIVQFNVVNVECLSGVQIAISHRSHVFCGGQGEGFDSGENLFFEVSLNGGAWTVVGTLGGFSNYAWTYATTAAGSGSTVANPFVYNVPVGTVTVAFRTRSQTDRADEVYYIDDVKLTTVTNGYNYPGTAGIWNGKVNTDWTNKCNWDDRNLPTSATDVYIPTTASNDCEVLATLTGNCHNLRIDKSKLIAKYFTSTLNVTGDLIIDNNGELDMSFSGNEGGTLNLSGNWLNKRDETYFKEGKSTVNFIGNTNQSIAILNDTKEAFYKTGLNKTGGILFTNTDIWIDKSIVGGTAPLFNLSNGLFDLNTHSLIIWNPNFQAVQRISGGIISELTNNANKIIWGINSNIGSYLFPFSRADGTYIPFTFNHTTGNAGDVTVSTYGTPPNNLPWPTTPTLVTNLHSSIGLAPDNRDATVDRFWQIDVSGSATADLTFTYAAGELPISPFNNPSAIQAQRFTTASNQWLIYLPGQSAGSYFVTVPSVTAFSTWTLTAITSPLPVELLSFNAIPEKARVNVLWTTVSEINNNYFTIQRSVDQVNFHDLGIIDGAGNSNVTLDYHYPDEHPLNGISYYRLMQTDFDGKTSYSAIVPVRYNSQSSFSIDYLYNDATFNSIHVLIQTDGVYSTYVELTDATGRTVFSKNLVADSNGKDISFSFSSKELSGGIYFFKATDGIHQQVKKIFIY